MYKYLILLIGFLTISCLLLAEDISSISDVTNDLQATITDSLQPYILNLGDSLKLDRYEHESAKKAAKFREKSDLCEYNIYLPKGFNRHNSYNLVIGLHGYLDTAENFGLLWKDINNKDIIFIVPESPFSVLESTQAVLKWGPIENY